MFQQLVMQNSRIYRDIIPFQPQVCKSVGGQGVKRFDILSIREAMIVLRQGSAGRTSQTSLYSLTTQKKVRVG